ncbi:acyl-CoA thioesterase [Pseudonocardia asaccharolytica]|uniref:Uncharacterized protein n=1 Tax=Pseudonocardia asaccharolytica DSM 44247 = NBRC 16224 TaxID=1123024 RepID=A0A511CWZ3_9PSEU|nr:thioesterase family protein [Pseudonocardia asaccharolytica]GEL16773.1 hypothetical protein PA7_06100 [Pseudonocardia asaccharolytica DSM 44247 = NBRC 16224]
MTDVAAPADTRPRVTISRPVEWCDTDAAGHHHHGAVLRWVEAAEAELLRRHGQAALFGRIPRVRYEVDYRNRLWFGQLVQVELVLARLGEKSIRYDFTVRGEDTVAATGSLTIAFAQPDSPRAEPWPEEVRAALGGQGRT